MMVLETGCSPSTAFGSQNPARRAAGRHQHRKALGLPTFRLMAGYRLGSRGVRSEQKVTNECTHRNSKHNPSIVGHEK